MSYYGPQPDDRPRDGAEVAESSSPSTKKRPVTTLTRSEHYRKFNKRLRKDIRPVPWRDVWELQDVGKALLSVLDDSTEPDTDKEHVLQSTTMTVTDAFEMISVWKSRLSVSDGLPHAIESTAALAQVYWRDTTQQQPRNTFSVSTSELRLAYSAAIVRCINGFADSLQQQRSNAASVSSLCASLGIPAWLVDIRHDAVHNALPSLQVLRLAASTLLEFLKAEYWEPTFSEANREATSTTTSKESGETSNEQSAQPYVTGIDCLLEYKACAAAWANKQLVTANATEATTSTADTATKNGKKRKDKDGLPKTKIISYDPLFGEVGSPSSSEEDSDDDEESDELEDSVVGNVWGSAIGTNVNRFSLLAPPKKVKRTKMKKSKPKKAVLNMPKRQKGEKSPTDWAKRFVKAVSLQDGYTVAIQFLVWGGVGGSPRGRGVLIPGSERTFPTTQSGVSKCWQRYSPLIHAVCRTWPGFCSTLLVNLVDFVLSIEDQVINQNEMDTGSARKLFFLSAWIQLLLSKRFVASLDEAFIVKNDQNASSKRKTKGDLFHLDLAQYDHLQILGYPLNSLLDRCQEGEHFGDEASQLTELRGTSITIKGYLQQIVGTKYVPHFGYKENERESLTSSTYKEARDTNINARNNEGGATDLPTSDEKLSTAISLDEMEALLSGEDSMRKACLSKEDETPTQSLAADMAKTNEEPPRRRAWVRCEIWDSCALGSLPGYPT